MSESKSSAVTDLLARMANGGLIAPVKEKTQQDEEIIKFRDFRGEAEASGFQLTATTEHIDKMLEVGDTYFKEFKYQVATGHIRLVYVHEIARRIMGSFYATGADRHYDIEEYFNLYRGE